MLDKDILIIIPIYHKISSNFYNDIKDYKNVLLLDNCMIDTKTLPNGNNNFTIMKFSEEWGNYIKNNKCKRFIILNQDNITLDTKNKGIVISYLTNYLFNSYFKGIYNRVLVFNQDSIEKFSNMPLNGFKSNIELFQYANTHNIAINITDYKINTNIKTKLNSIKTLIPYIFRNILSYIVNIILFLVLFYILKFNNELEHILVANFFSGVVGVALLILLDYNPYFHNNYIKKNIIYILINLVKISISGYIIYILYKIIGIPIIISKLIGDILLLVGVEILKNKFFTHI